MPCRSIKDSQSKALRAWYNDDSTPGTGLNSKKTLEDCGRWWNEHKILGVKYTYLDERPVPDWKDAKRQRADKWEVLEEALFEWAQRIFDAEPRIFGAVYPAIKANPALNGPKDGFKASKARHNEASSADINDRTRDIMGDTRKASQSFDAEDIFNMDETG
ncbi:hypothetical protein HO133_006709 [Letharia lupina]|uniref:Transposase n=1 Tax=Letharia lupina TaxID=560253 RepID=A0A8H6C5V9_9LECA|nr:uncharacterized protein HO133_006709 [Letharia lupina]KAF6217607.1 hypothetical protein HO133_006709 [Letharia lupina]